VVGICLFFRLLTNCFKGAKLVVVKDG